MLCAPRAGLVPLRKGTSSLDHLHNPFLGGLGFRVWGLGFFCHSPQGLGFGVHDLCLPDMGYINAFLVSMC